MPVLEQGSGEGFPLEGDPGMQDCHKDSWQSPQGKEETFKPHSAPGNLGKREFWQRGRSQLTQNRRGMEHGIN